MQRRRLLALAAAAWPAAHAAAGYETLAWSALMPPGWDGRAQLAALAPERLTDGDPEAQQALEQLRRLWDAAPANPALHGRRVRLSGYLMPMEFAPEVIREFLLMPYFGACIHEPAPPANQVVHVLTSRPITAAERGTSAFTVTGVLTVARRMSEPAVSGYRLQADSVLPYKP